MPCPKFYFSWTAPTHAVSWHSSLSSLAQSSHSTSALRHSRPCIGRWMTWIAPLHATSSVPGSSSPHHSGSVFLCLSPRFTPTTVGTFSPLTSVMVARLLIFTSPAARESASSCRVGSWTIPTTIAARDSSRRSTDLRHSQQLSSRCGVTCDGSAHGRFAARQGRQGRGFCPAQQHSMHGELGFVRETYIMTTVTRPNHALQRTRRGRPGCNRCVPFAGSLSLG